MGVVDDSRKVIQDFPAPELRSISVRLDAFENLHDSLNHKIDQVDSRAERRHTEAIDRIGQVEKHAEKRHDEVLRAIASVSDISDPRERMARIESNQRPHR